MFDDSVRVDAAVRFPELAAAIGAVAVRPDRGGTAAQCAADTRALLELSRALQSRLHAQVACLDEQGFAAGLGFASTAAWLAGYGNLDGQQARRVVRAARTADRLPLLGARHSAGKIGVEHLSAVADGAPRVPVEVLVESDKTFADFSGSARPGELRLVAQRMQAAYDQAAVSEDADHVHESRRLTLARTFGDAWHVEGLLEPVDGAALDIALQSLMAPRDSEDDRTITQRRADALIELAQVALAGGQLPDTGGDRPRLTFLVTTPTPSTPGGHTPGGGTPSGHTPGGDVVGGDVVGGGPGGHTPGGHTPGGDVVVGGVVPVLAPAGAPIGRGSTEAGLAGLVGLGGLPGRLTQMAEAGLLLTVAGFGDGITDPSAALLGLNALIPARTITRIGCQADVNVAIRDPAGDILNHGRAHRHHSPAQRRAVVLRDQHCVFPGCDVPPWRCIVHHLQFWSNNGRTDLINLALLCLFHHHRIHDHDWRLRRHQPHPGAPITWIATAPDGHQLRQPRQPRQPAA